jgi:dTDP-4-amino-4,6-dideoxygalactose transaminase
LTREPAAAWPPAFGGRPTASVPAAREGLLWFLTEAGIGEGDEVAVPALLCEVVGTAIVKAGAQPVTFGVSDVDFGPSLTRCREALSPATQAVVVPHLYGVPADLDGFRALCHEHDCLLIEDCAPCVVGQSGAHEVGSVGECSLYSFQYDKPLSLGWGGAVGLSDAARERVGLPGFPAMSEEEDRLLAASLLLQHALSDKARLGGGFLAMTFALEWMLGHREWVEDVLSLATDADGAAKLECWCSAHITAPRSPASGGVRGGVKRLLKRVLPAPLVRWLRRARERPSVEPFAGRTLRPDGLCERLLAAQYERLRQGEDSAARARIGRIYAEGLDREKMVVPLRSCSPRHWLRFPVAVRGGHGRRDRLVERALRELEVEIAPYVWRVALHQVPSLHGHVRPGPGSDETADLMDGLLNLPVHAQVTDQDAHRIVEFLNHA